MSSLLRTQHLGKQLIPNLMPKRFFACRVDEITPFNQLPIDHHDLEKYARVSTTYQQLVGSQRASKFHLNQLKKKDWTGMNKGEFKKLFCSVRSEMAAYLMENRSPKGALKEAVLQEMQQHYNHRVREIMETMELNGRRIQYLQKLEEDNKRMEQALIMTGQSKLKDTTDGRIEYRCAGRDSIVDLKQVKHGEKGFWLTDESIRVDRDVPDWFKG